MTRKIDAWIAPWYQQRPPSELGRGQTRSKGGRREPIRTHRDAGRRTTLRRVFASLMSAMLLGSIGVATAKGVNEATPGPVALSGNQEANACLTSGGVDLNALFGVSDQIVTRFCPEASAGEHWSPFGFWIVNSSNDAFPPGYVPSGATPIEDFVAKLVRVEVVVDGGTSQERTFVFPPSQVVRTDVGSDQLEPGLPQLPMAATLPRLKPLSVGQHTRELIWVLSAQHCDGFGTSVDDNCLPSGDVSFGAAPFAVVRPATSE